MCALQVVALWREDLASINAKAAESLADPVQYPNLFPNLDLALHAEQYQVWCSTLTCPKPSCFLFSLAVCDLVFRGLCLNLCSLPSLHTSEMAWLKQSRSFCVTCGCLLNVQSWASRHRTG